MFPSILTGNTKETSKPFLPELRRVQEIPEVHWYWKGWIFIRKVYEFLQNLKDHDGRIRCKIGFKALQTLCICVSSQCHSSHAVGSSFVSEYHFIPGQCVEEERVR